MRRKTKCGRQTDGQTDMVIPVYPPNFVAGGIKNFQGVSLPILLWKTPDASAYQILPIPIYQK